MATIVLRRPVRTWWPALLAFALVVMAGGVVVVAAAPPARAAQSPVSCANSVGLVDGSFEQPVIPANSYRFIQQGLVPGWSTTATDNNIEIWHNDFNGVHAAAGNQHAELNATQFSNLYQDQPTIPGTVMRWSLAHRGRAGLDTMAVSIGAPGGPLVEQRRMTDGTNAWGTYSGFYTVPDGQTTTRFSFEAVSTAGGNISVGNFLDDISFGTNACVIGSETFTSATGDGYAQVGDLITITVKANSGGGSPAMGTYMTSALPAGVSFVPGSIRVSTGAVTTSPTDGAGDDVGEYDPVTRQVAVRVGNQATASTGGSLANEEVGTLTYQVRVDPLSAPMTTTSQSTVTFTDPLTDKVRTSTTNSPSIVLVPIADVGVTLARTGTGDVVAGVPTGDVIAGLSVTYTATLTNNGGPSTVPGEDYAYGTKLTSQLPAALTKVSGTTAGGTCSVVGSTLTCTVGTLKRNATATVTLTGTVASDTLPGPGALTLTVRGVTGSRDLVPGNDTASVTDEVKAKADVGVTLSATPSPAVAGADLTYTAVLTNRGPSMARGLSVYDPVPAGTSDSRASVPGGTCSPRASDPVTCSLPTLAAGASTSVTIVLRTAPDRTAAVVNKLKVSAETPDPITSDNTVSLTTAVTSTADLSTTMTVQIPAGSVPLGGSFPFTLTIHNAGPSTAVNIQLSLRDGLPNGFAPTSLPAGCTLSGCSFASLDPGKDIVLKGTAGVARTAAPGRATVNVTATSATSDPDLTNNTGSAVVLVGAPSVQVSVLGAITDTRRTLGAKEGDGVVWTYVVTNTGDVDVNGLTVVVPGTSSPVPTTCVPGTLPKGATAACRGVVPQVVTATDVGALAATTRVQVTAAWVGGTEVRSPSAEGSLRTVLPQSIFVQASAVMLQSPGITTAAATRPTDLFAPTVPWLLPADGRTGR